uniref:SH3 domain-containing protein n=2 Tax=Ciona intestinalis TaxID=7719 RepID=F6XFV0_CIOIN
MKYMCFFLLLVCINEVTGYAKLGETVNCANEDCSETISEGKAKLVYRPKDEKFLQMKKGDVVLVQGKKAGDQTELWVGQNLFKKANKQSSVFHQDQNIVIEKSNSEVTKTEKTNVAEESVDKNPDISSNNVDAEKEEHKKDESIYKEKLEILGDQKVNADTDSTKLNKDDAKEINKEQENNINEDISINLMTDEEKN